MTIDEIRELVKTDQYSFLRENPHLGENIILLGLGGSYAYGTNTDASDIDIRGIALNSKDEILTAENFEQFCNVETDTTVYSFNKMIQLLCSCNPNTIEILGLRPEQYLFISSIGQELLDRKHMFLSKKAIGTFGGYANQQLYRLNQLCTHKMPQDALEQHIFRTIDNLTADFTERYKLLETNSLRLYVDDSNREDMTTEIFMDVDLTHYPLRDYCSMWNELQNIVKSYGKIGRRNDHAKEHGKIAKHMMHLVRLYLMCIDILEKEDIITYREDDHEMLMEIRNGKYVTENNQVKPEFYDLVKSLENRLEKSKSITKLPDKPDYKSIREFVISVNKRVVDEFK